MIVSRPEVFGQKSFGTSSSSGPKFGPTGFLAGAGFRVQRSHKIGYINDSISITIFGIGSDREWPGVLESKIPLNIFKFQPWKPLDHPTVNPFVPGSSPGRGANKNKDLQ